MMSNTLFKNLKYKVQETIKSSCGKYSMDSNLYDVLQVDISKLLTCHELFLLLSQDEIEILDLFSKGLSRKDVSKKSYKSLRTIYRIRENIMDTLQKKSFQECINAYIRVVSL